MQNTLSSLSPELMEAIVQAVIAEQVATKRTENAWQRAKASIREEIKPIVGANAAYYIVDSIAVIARKVWGKHTVANFTEADVATIREMLKRMLVIALEYKGDAP